MSKQVRTLLIVGIVVLVLGGLLTTLLLLPSSGSGETSSAATSSDPSISLISKSTDSSGSSVAQPVKKAVFKLGDVEEVKDKDGNVTTEAKKGEEFTVILNEEGVPVVESYADLPINTSTLRSLTSGLASISAKEKVEGVDAEMADYGFDKPLASVTVTYHDDSEYSFEIGGRTPLKTGYYYREAGTETVYVVNDSFCDTVMQDSLTYVGTSLYVSPTVEEDDEDGKAILRDLKLSGSVRPSSFAFRATTTEDPKELRYSDYVLTSPYLRNTNANAITELISNMTALSATKAVVARPTDEQLEEYGLKNPYSVADLNLAVKSVEKSEESESSDSEEEKPTRYYNVQHHVVKLGNKDADGNYYCMIDDVPVIYLVSASSVAWAETQYDDVANVMLFMRDITSISTISVKVNGKETLFKLEHFPDAETTDEKLTVTVDGQTYSTPEFRTFYTILMSLRRTGEAKVEPTGDPYLEIQLTTNDEEPQTITAKLYKATSSTYTCQLDTGETYKVNATEVENVEKQMAKYLAGEELDHN